MLPGPSGTGLPALAVLKEEARLALGAACGQWSRGDDLTGLTVGATGVALPLVEELSGGLATGAGCELGGAFLARRVTFLAEIVLVEVALGTSFASIRGLTLGTMVEIALHAGDLGPSVLDNLLIPGLTLLTDCRRGALGTSS